MAAHEVMQKQFKDIMGYNPSYFCADGEAKEGLDYLEISRPAAGEPRVQGMNTENFPVENVSYEEAVEFCHLLTERERKAKKIGSDQEYSLPTEAEWEYACRGGASSPTNYHFGNSLEPDQANYSDSRLGRTCKVGSYPANDFGLFDMHGNVLEWCLGGPSWGVFRVMRGGAWDRDAGCGRSAYRVFNKLGYRFRVVGFRVALVAIRG